MLAIILTAGGLLAAVAALVLVSENFAYGVSRVVEAAFESIEVRLDRRDRARLAAERAAVESEQLAAGRVVVLRAGAAAVRPYARVSAAAAGVTGPLRAG
jgi:hypothetical protein